MGTVGWAAGAIIFLGGVFGVLHYLLIELTKLIRACIRSMREIRNEMADYRAERKQASADSPISVVPLGAESGRVPIPLGRLNESSEGGADPGEQANSLPAQE